MSYFSFLNLIPTFDIDLSVLEDEYFKAQRQFHPDKFVGKSEQEKLVALQKSMDINKAYEILSNPLKRAQYLLELQGIIVGTDSDNVKIDNAILMEIIELNEQLAKSESVNRLSDLYENSLLDISKYYANKDWQKMAQETLRLGYLLKLLERSSL